MEDTLRKAAESGDVEFLRNCVASNKPMEYYLSNTINEDNMLHLAVLENRVEFIKEATNILPIEIFKMLIQQQSGEEMCNPLHKAAIIGNVDVVRLFMDVFRVLAPLPVEARPWSAKTKDGRTPCHWALYCDKEECGLELLKMDMELLCNMVDEDKFSLMGIAVFKGLNRVALEILKCPYSFSCLFPEQASALHYVTKCTEGEDICRKLLERKPELIKQTSITGDSIFTMWASEHKLWPFQCLLNSNDIIPDIKRVFVDLISATNCDGFNPLCVLAANELSSEKEDMEIAKLLIDTYKQEASSSSLSKDMFPWLTMDKQGGTPLVYAIDREKQQFAMYLMSEDENAVIKGHSETLLFAIEKGCSEVALRILDIVDDKGLTQFLTNEQQVHALHIAPLCSKAFLEQVLVRHPNLLERVDKDGNTIFHIWVKIGQVWPFEYVLQSEHIDGNRRRHFIKLICASNYKERNSPLHVIATTTTTQNQEKSHQIARILVEAYKKETPQWRTYLPVVLPWCQKNKYREGAIHLAMCNQDEKLALYILSQHEANSINTFLDFYQPEHKTLFLAIEKSCFQVAKEILAKLDKENRTKYLMDSSNGRSVLHLASTCADKNFGTWLVNEAIELITQPDKNGTKPIDEACNVGASWIVEAILKNDPSLLTSSPLAWVNACENGHISVIHTFINEHPEKFRNHCIEYKDTPLHRLQLSNHTEYVMFLKIQSIKDLINVQDHQGATPLHKAIQNRNIFLTETLLVMDNIMYNLKNENDETAIDILEQVCDEDYRWEQMCKRIGFDPRIKTTYFEQKTNLLDLRNSLMVVAALLATITFTAGFTLPGGLNQGTGEAMLGKKAAFLVFLLSDTLAMCISMLAIVCLVWSMVYVSSDSLLLVDRSLVLLMISLYLTLLAFMTAVYVVISPISLWAAIFVIAFCCIVGVSANRTLLYKVLFISSKNKEHNQIGLMQYLKLFKRECAGRKDLEMQN